MALNAAVEWDVRTTGSDSNAGGFRAGATGTDYSIQDAAQITYTDLVIGGTNTQLTSAAFPFSALHVGNIINITAGTGFTVGRYEILSVAGVIATMDRAVGTAASTGGQGKLGGALLTNATAFAFATAGNTIWLKAGTYTLTAQISIIVASQWRGYATAHGDLGVRPLVTTSTDSTVLATNSGSGRRCVDNINFSNTALVKAGRYQTSTGGLFATISNCNFDGFTTGLNGGTQRFAMTLINVRVVNCSSVGLDMGSNPNLLYGCYFRNNAAYNVAGTTVELVIDRCIIADSDGSRDTAGDERRADDDNPQQHDHGQLARHRNYANHGQRDDLIPPELDRLREQRMGDDHGGGRVESALAADQLRVRR